MFSKSKSLLWMQRTLLQSVEFPESAAFTQIVRWRMRRWAPKNPSKVWYVPERKVQDVHEYTKLRVLNAHYSTRLRSLRSLFKDEISAKKVAAADKSHEAEAAKDYAERIEINRIWNEQTGDIRESRQANEEQEDDEMRLTSILKAEEEREERMLRARLLVEKEQVESEYFINAENMDEEIEKALNSRVNYNFAIDLIGNRYIEMVDGSASLDDSQSGDSRNPVSTFIEESEQTARVNR